jgi:hypothetical protein
MYVVCALFVTARVGMARKFLQKQRAFRNRGLILDSGETKKVRFLKFVVSGKKQ